jgi:hypothetical protein
VSKITIADFRYLAFATLPMLTLHTFFNSEHVLYSRTLCLLHTAAAPSPRCSEPLCTRSCATTGTCSTPVFTIVCMSC